MGLSRPDISFAGVRVAVFVDGCFWHSCPDHGSTPKTNSEWWREKLDTNVNRDHATNEALRKGGWEVVRIWEHEDPAAGADRIEAAVRARREVGSS